MLFLVCSVAGLFISGNIKLALILIFVLSLVFILILSIFKFYSANKKHTFLTVTLCLLMASLSFISSYSFYNKEYDKRSLHYDKESFIQGIVLNVRYINNYSSCYVINVDTLNGKGDEHKAILECKYPAALEIGDRITAKVIASEPESNNGRYDEKLSYMSDGIFVIYSSSDESSLDFIGQSSENRMDIFFTKLNDKISTGLTRKIDGNAGDLSSALFLGNKYLLSEDIIRDFKRVGASHILALSGLHMSLIMGAIMLILKLTVKKSTPIAFILSFIALFYLAMTGFSVSATRSVIMLLTVYLSMIISSMPDSLTSLSIAGFVIVLISPGAIVDASFWMSFSATLGILVYMSPLNQFFGDKLAKYKNKLQHFVLKIVFSIICAVATSLAALIPLLIVMCIFIKEISLLSVLSSVILSLPTAIIIISTLILLPLNAVPYLSAAIIYIIRFASNIMVNYCAYFTDLEDMVISLNYPFATAMALLLGIALLISLISKMKKPVLSLVPFAICLAVCISSMAIYEYVNKDKLNVSYINASSNSDILVVSNQKKAIICDMSNGSVTSFQKALDELYKSRATEIKAIMLTRYTYQHNATLYKLFMSNTVREIWIPTPENTDDLYKMEVLYGFAQENDVLVYLYEKGETIKAFDHTYIEHTSEYIERSKVPISLVGIYTGEEHLTYVSSGFNESELLEEAEFAFSRSQYVIFGNRGPKTKTPYDLGESRDLRKIKSVVFSDETRVAFYIPPEHSFISYYLVPKEEKIEFYMDK